MSYIIKVLNMDGDLGMVGVLSHVKKDNGTQFFTFIPYVSGRTSSRKSWDTAKGAIPNWARGTHGAYIVKADSADKALALVKGYRDGVQWANTEALAGNIDVIQGIKRRKKAA